MENKMVCSICRAKKERGEVCISKRTGMVICKACDMVEEKMRQHDEAIKKLRNETKGE